MIFQTKSSRFLSAYSPQKYRLIEIKFGDHKIIGKCGYEGVCNKSYGALRTFMQNNPFFYPACQSLDACAEGGGCRFPTG
jgi:hypothetical protein